MDKIWVVMVDGWGSLFSHANEPEGAFATREEAEAAAEPYGKSAVIYEVPWKS